MTALIFGLVYFFLVPSILALCAYICLNGLQDATWAQFGRHMWEDWRRAWQRVPRARVVQRSGERWS